MGIAIKQILCSAGSIQISEAVWGYPMLQRYSKRTNIRPPDTPKASRSGKPLSWKKQRLCHWSLALGFVLSFFSAEIDEFWHIVLSYAFGVGILVLHVVGYHIFQQRTVKTVVRKQANWLWRIGNLSALWIAATLLLSLISGIVAHGSQSWFLPQLDRSFARWHDTISHASLFGVLVHLFTMLLGFPPYRKLAAASFHTLHQKVGLRAGEKK